MTNVTRTISKPQASALDWLVKQGGSGTFDASGQQITAGDKLLPYRREIWVALRDAGRVEFFNDGDATPYGAVRAL